MMKWEYINIPSSAQVNDVIGRIDRWTMEIINPCIVEEVGEKLIVSSIEDRTHKFEWEGNYDKICSIIDENTI